MTMISNSSPLPETLPTSVSEQLVTAHTGRGDMDGPGDAVWILTSAFIIFTMISGFGLVESGMVSRKNETNIMVKNAVDVIFGGLGFWMFGFAFTFGDAPGVNSFSGFGRFFTDAEETDMGEVFSLYCFQASFATTATTIVSGAVAERMNLKAYIIFAFTNTATYCFPAHWVWGKKGWLKEMGVVDMGGASPVHLVGGVAGLVATMMLKPRLGRFRRTTGVAPWKHDMGCPTNVLLGMFMLWWGWLGFNCGSTFGVSGGKWKLATRSAVCTINASCGGGIFATIYSYIKCKRLDIPFFMAGILGSLVSITAICGVVRPGESIAIGFVGSAITIFGWQLLNKLQIDDPVGAISTHAGGSVWAMISVGLFVEKDSLPQPFSSSYGAFKGGHVKILGVQLLACVSIIVWTILIVFIQLYVIDKCVGLRLAMEEEIIGADACEHGIEPAKSDINSCLVTALPLSPNCVFPAAISEHRENSVIATSDFSSQVAREENCENKLDDYASEDHEEPVIGVTEDDTQKNNETKQPYQSSQINQGHLSFVRRKPAYDDCNSISTCSARNRSGGIVSRPIRSPDKVKGSNRRPVDSSLQGNRSTVIITLTPVDDDRAVRLSVSDLHKLKN
ncbi:putative ammonium transporter 2 [Montipora capricornis]|uniref:putative ammonium transporter 2 n=1 Tax=Montipora capricornis TaxID=246305 RepID=UPI0035F1DAC3